MTIIIALAVIAVLAALAVACGGLTGPAPKLTAAPKGRHAVSRRWPPVAVMVTMTGELARLYGRDYPEMTR